MTQQHISGGCLCGSVTYSALTARDIVTYCHCKQCRTFTGHQWAAVRVMEKDLTWQSDDGLTWYAATDAAKRGFCNRCGTSLVFSLNDTDFVGLAVGSITAPTGLSAAQHIFCTEKGDYYEIADGLPQFDGWPQ